MASSPAQRSREDRTAFRSGAAAAAPASLVVLTRDAALVEAVRAAVGAGHRVVLVAGDGALIDQLMASPVRATLIDSAACAQPIARLTERLITQFPDLVLVVTGTAEDQAALATQITDGRVFRFLHKPVSAQRVKLFVESAFRRSDAAPPPAAATVPTPVRAGSGRSRTPLIIAGMALAALAGAAVWWAARDTATPGSQRAAGADRTPAVVPVALNATLDRADAALARGALVAPPGESAVDLYRQVLAGSPGNTRAIAGINAVVDRLVGEAEQAIGAGRIDEASRLAETARGVRADHPRVAFLTTQIDKERERAVLTAARQAAASGHLDRAISVLERGSGEDSGLIDATKRELQQREVDAQAAGFLALADERTKSGALLAPAQDNARFYIESARALAPEDAAIGPAETALRSALVSEARRAIAAGDLTAAEQWITAADENHAPRAELAALRGEFERAQIGRRAEQLTALAARASEDLRQNRLIEPASDNARAAYREMRELDPQHPATLAARDALGRALLAESRRALERADAAGAERWIAEAEAIGFAGTLLAGARRDVATLRAREQAANTVVSAGQLARTRTVQPRYPDDARTRGVTGWVDLEFTVTTDGTVNDVRVVGAAPTGVFEDAATEAIGRWRFKPVERNGVAVPQRAKLRIRFDLE